MLFIVMYFRHSVNSFLIVFPTIFIYNINYDKYCRHNGGVKMSIGKNIKQYRKDKKLTQLELAKKSNISRSYLGDIENDRYNPSIETLNSIAKSLGIEPSLLLGKIAPNPNLDVLTRKDERDIAKDVNAIMKKMADGEDGPIYYNGEEMDEEDADLFKAALEVALRSIKIENKQKYTPKKYRK